MTSWWTPFLVSLLSAVLATAGAWVAIAFDRRKTVNQELVRKRIAIYDLIAPKLNDLYCFSLSVGPWKKLTPADMIEHKRELDRLVHVYAALFSEDLATSYHVFIQTIFATFRGAGVAAKIRVSRHRLSREWGSEWKPEWDSAFVDPDEATSHEEVVRTYRDLMRELACEIGAQRRRK